MLRCERRASRRIARDCQDARDFLFLGRGPQYPIALEGALKLKEISYIHAEGYAAGEMKHGPIALIDEKLPVVVIAPRGPGYEKIIGNIAGGARAAAGRVIAVCVDGDEPAPPRSATATIQVPDAPPLLLPLLTVRRCSSSPTTWPISGAPTSTSRAIWRRP